MYMMKKFMIQVYGIHAVIEGKCMPMVYCILPRKTEDMYTKLLNVIKSKINSRDSISILKNRDEATPVGMFSFQFNTPGTYYYWSDYVTSEKVNFRGSALTCLNHVLCFT